jgi:hypothetical protein
MPAAKGSARTPLGPISFDLSIEIMRRDKKQEQAVLSRATLEISYEFSSKPP